MQEYVFLDANILIYYGKAQLYMDGATLDRLLIPDRQIVVTTTVLNEVLTGGTSFRPEREAIRQWIDNGVENGKIILEQTPNTGRDGGERSIIDLITGEYSELSHPSRVVTNNWKDFKNSDILINSAQQYLLESLIYGGSSIAEYVVDSNILAASGINAGPPLLPIMQLIDLELYGINGVHLIINPDGGLTITEPSGKIHHMDPFDRFRIDKSGTVEFLGSYDPFCFPAGTQILTPDGTVSIENIEVGHSVMSFDTMDNLGRGTLVPKKVIRVFENETSELVRISWREGQVEKQIHSTPGHKLLSGDGRFYTALEFLHQSNPKIVISKGNVIDAEFELIRDLSDWIGPDIRGKESRCIKTYNMEVEDFHTYVAGGVRVHNDSQVVIDSIGSVSRLFGTQLSNIMLKDESALTKIVGGTIIGTISENIAEVIADIGYHAFDGRQISFSTALRQVENFDDEISQSLVGSISSLLVAELGEELGIAGFGSELFNVGASAYLGSTAQQAIHNYAQYGDAFKNIKWDNAWLGVESAFGAYVGSKLASEIIAPTSLEGSIGGGLGSIIGAAGASSYFNAGAFALGNLLVPGIGVFIGTMFGTFFGNLFGGDEPDPEGLIDLFITRDGQTTITGGQTLWALMTSQDGFPSSVTHPIAEAVHDITLGYLKNIEAFDLSNANITDYELTPDHQIMTGLPQNPLVRVLQKMKVEPSGDQLRYYVNDIRVSSAEKMVDAALTNFIKEAQPIGGNLILKRALANSTAIDSITLSSHAAAAEEFTRYYENREVINNLIVSKANSVFSAGWAIVLSHAEELKLRAVNETDFNGGLFGFLNSLENAGISTYQGDVNITRNSSNSIIIRIPTVDRDSVPEIASLAADRVTYIESQTGNYLEFAFGHNLKNAGYNSVSGKSLVSGHYEVTGESSGRDIWFGSDDRASIFEDVGDHIINSNQAEIESSDDILIGGNHNSGDTIKGGTGWDWIEGRSGTDQLFGGDQADSIFGGDSNDTIYGGAGIDFLEGGGGSDYISGLIPNPGTDFKNVFDLDTAGYTKSTSAVYIKLGDGTAGGGIASGGHATGDSLHYILNVVGSKYNDTLIGNDNRNVLEGGAGADTLDGGTKSQWTDFASYARSSESVFASLRDPSSNTGDAFGDVYKNIGGLIGSAHSDILEAGSGDSFLWGEAGDDILVAGSGFNEFVGGFGLDTFSYRNSHMGLTVNLTNWKLSSSYVADDVLVDIEAIQGSSFEDHFVGSTVNDILLGEGGNDVLYGGGGNDALSGEAGNDLIRGGDGLDSLFGGSGFDVLFGDGGQDLLDGGEDRDRVDYTYAQKSVTVDLENTTANTGEAAGDSYISVEGVKGSIYSDRILGDLINNSLWGEDGNDSLYGRDGDDTLYGGSGKDSLDGGSGNDLLSGGEGDDIYVIGSTRDKVIEASDGGLDMIKSSVSIDLDSINSKNVENVTLLGSGSHSIYGSSAHSVLVGNQGNNTITGRSGNDSINGGGGQDVLSGGAGYDLLTGGAGADKFIFTRGDDMDTFNDFSHYDDKIEIRGYSLTRASELEPFSRQDGMDLVIDFGSGDALRVKNTNFVSVSDDFIFA